MRNIFYLVGLLLVLASASASAQSTSSIALTSSSNTAPAYISMTNINPSAPTLTQVGDIYFYSAYTHPGQALIEAGTAGSATGDFGGFLAFHTKADDGLGSDGEALVLTPGHHVTMPFGQYYVRFNSPGACAAGVACGSSTWTFSTPYANPSGVPQQPNCPSILIQDESVPGQMWVGGIGAISATAVTYNYAPLVAVAAAHTIDVYAVCYALGF